MKSDPVLMHLFQKWKGQSTFAPTPRATSTALSAFDACQRHRVVKAVWWQRFVLSGTVLASGVWMAFVFLSSGSPELASLSDEEAVEMFFNAWVALSHDVQ